MNELGGDVGESAGLGIGEMDGWKGPPIVRGESEVARSLLLGIVAGEGTTRSGVACFDDLNADLWNLL